MKTMVQHRYGPPEALTLEEAPVPVPREDEVLLRVHAAGVNVADDLITRGTPYVAGTVLAVGTGVTGAPS